MFLRNMRERGKVKPDDSGHQEFRLMDRQVEVNHGKRGSLRSKSSD
jgi:hypothetical protein